MIPASSWVHVVLRPPAHKMLHLGSQKTHFWMRDRQAPPSPAILESKQTYPGLHSSPYQISKLGVNTLKLLVRDPHCCYCERYIGAAEPTPSLLSLRAPPPTTAVYTNYCLWSFVYPIGELGEFCWVCGYCYPQVFNYGGPGGVLSAGPGA